MERKENLPVQRLGEEICTLQRRGRVDYMELPPCAPLTEDMVTDVNGVWVGGW